MNHDVFKDLAPNYIDHLTSSETNELMENHLEKCEECQNYLDNMRENYLLENREEQKNEKKDIDYMKKVRSKNKKKIYTITGILVSIFTAILIGSYIIIAHMWLANEEDIKISVQQQGTLVSLSFETKNSNRYLLPIEVFSEVYPGEIIVYEKWNDFSETATYLKDKSSVTYTFIDENTLLSYDGKEIKLTDKDKIQIKYKDHTEEILLNKLYKKDNK